MTTLQRTFVVSVGMILCACSTVPPIPVTADPSVPAVVETDGLRAMLRVLPRAETDRIFGRDTGAQMGVVELNVANRGASPMSVERKLIRIVMPTGQDHHPVSPFGVANRTRSGPAMTSSGINALDAIQLVFGLATLARNYDIASKWDHVMPEVFKVAAGEERRMLLAFPTPHWSPGLWRLEVPFNTDTGGPGPHLSIPLTFKATGRVPS